MQNSYWAMMRNSCIINSFSLDHLVIFDSFNALFGNDCIDAISTNQCRMSTILVSEAYFNTLFLMFGRFVFWFSYSTMATWEVNFYCFCRSSTTKDIFLIWIMYSGSFKCGSGIEKKCPKNFFSIRRPSIWMKAMFNYSLYFHLVTNHLESFEL